MIKEEKDSGIAIVVTILIAVIIICALGGFSFYKKNELAHENFSKAKDAYRKNDFVKAEQLLNVNPPRDIAEDFYNLKFDIQFIQNNLSEAEQTIKKLIDIKPKNAFYYYKLSLIYYNLGENDKTEQALKKAVEMEPKNFTYNLSLANINFEREKYDEAIKLYLDIYKMNPKAEIALDSIINCYEAKNNPDKVLEYRVKAAKEFSDHLYDIYKLAELYESLGKRDLALEYYEKAIKLDYDDESDAKEKYKKLAGKPYYGKGGYDIINIPFRSKANLMYFSATLGGKKGEFLLDTGASFSVVSNGSISGIKYKETGMSAVAEMADGSKRDVKLVLANLKLADYDFGETLVGIVPVKDPISIIGNSVWSNLEYYADNSKKVIVIKRPKE